MGARSAGLISALLIVVGCATTTRPVRVPYAIEGPLDRPVPFAGGRITTINGIAFDESGASLFVAVWQPDLDPRGRRRLRIQEWRHDGRDWTGPFIPSFSSRDTDYQPVYSPDRRRLYFQSTRPVPGDTVEVLQNLWFVDRSGAGWSEPRFIAELNTAAREGYVAPLADGTLYFNSDRPGGRGLQDFYRARRVAGQLLPPEPVTELNTADSENDLFVDPGGRFLIFNRFIESTRSVDLYVSFPAGSGWGSPRPLDNLNDTTAAAWELTPSVSPDGRYFFYTVDGTIMQLELGALIYEDELPGVGRRRRG